MAIFGGEDTNLHVITQLMQVNLSDEEELKRFFIRSFACSENERFWRFAPVTSEWKPSMQPLDEKEMFYFSESTARKQLAEEGGEKLLEGFFPLCNSLQWIFTQLCATGELMVKEMLSVRNQYPVGPDGLMPLAVATGVMKGESCEIPELISMGEAVPVHSVTFQNGTAYLAWVMDHTLLECWRGKKHLLRCAECFHVFVAERKNTQYCSHRCATRVGQRKRRKSKQDVAL